MKKEEEIDILGISMSRLELLCNGIAFLLIEIGYSVFNIVKQLPEGWRDNPEAVTNVQESSTAFWISLFLFIVSYSMISRSFFGGDRDKEIAKKDGTGTLLFKKFLLIFIMIVGSTLLKIGITLLVA